MPLTWMPTDANKTPDYPESTNQSILNRWSQSAHKNVNYTGTSLEASLVHLSKHPGIPTQTRSALKSPYADPNLGRTKLHKVPSWTNWTLLSLMLAEDNPSLDGI